jgi:hypothetical protein
VVVRLAVPFTSTGYRHAGCAEAAMLSVIEGLFGVGRAGAILLAVALVLAIAGLQYEALTRPAELARFDHAALVPATITASRSYRTDMRAGERRYDVAIAYTRTVGGRSYACRARLDLWGERRDFSVGDTLDVMVPDEPCGQPSAREEATPPLVTQSEVILLVLLVGGAALFLHAMERTRHRA